MSYNFDDRPSKFNFIMIIILVGLVYSFGDLSAASFIIPFFLVLYVTNYFLEIKKCVFWFSIAFVAGAIGAICYWLFNNREEELIKIILYGGGLGLLWTFIESLADKEYCK